MKVDVVLYTDDNTTVILTGTKEEVEKSLVFELRKEDGTPYDDNDSMLDSSENVER